MHQDLDVQITDDLENLALLMRDWYPSCSSCTRSMLVSVRLVASDESSIFPAGPIR